METVHSNGEYLAPEIKVMEINTSQLLCLSEETGALNSVEMKPEEW